MHDQDREPDWIVALREECGRTSQSKTAAALGVSTAMVNQVLKGTYKGNWERIETLVRGELMNATVMCPVLGEISCRKCLDLQALPFAPTNPQRVAVYKACRSGCEFSKLED